MKLFLIFSGLFLTDLVQIDEGNKDTLDGLIHFKKCSLIAGVVKKIQRCQTTNYKLLPVPELQQYLLSLGGSSAIEAIALQRKSAEAQLTFLNTTSASITDRNKSYNDLRGDRANLWIEWSERIEDPTNTTLYYFADGRSCSFLEILLLSVAVENSIHSAMLEYPKDLELMLFTRLLQLTLHAPNSVDAILEFVQYTQNIRAPAIHRTAMANMISSFKALHPTPRNIKTLPRLSQRNSQVSKKEESDHHDLGAIRSKRKRCNRLAVKISSANEILNNGISKIEVNEQLLNHANMNHVNNYREFVISQIGYLLADVSKFESRLQSVREEQHNQRLLEQQNLASTMENLEALKMELLRVNNLIETISCNLQTEQLKEENFLKNFQLTVDNKESQLRQVYESEQLLNGFLENTMKTSSEIRNEAHCRIVESLQSLETFLSTELAAIKSLGARLDSCKKDIQVMGIRYGPAIAGALEENYRSLKEAFTTNSLHVEYSIESLHSISSDSSMFECE
jgi:CII-binding regulator of phage lambda lysogenization HflD